jgi:malic enzyme
VAKAVARAARDGGLCEPFDDETIAQRIADKMWEPKYCPYRLRRPQ